ncbi:MAG: Ig-like domain-containing protein [Candidatus Peregrinibacteria bacterium Greene0416_62]|nr:MAG: Ig-like domain-containing protein [Candidatus Peregrinibacteria bacterium Greene0416_62]TSC97980.1 MAG: Ig-like domain-containing protein [Candidatus Peregrinibacteria bacterium Greene1014_49]
MIGFMHKHLYPITALLLIPQIVLSAGALEIADTIAGLGTTVIVRGGEANASVQLTVEPPYGPQIALSAKTDATGNASVRIDGADTEIAGTYSVTAALENDATDIQNTFDVHPDSIDGMASTLETSGVALTANGSDEITVRAVIRDRYGNPVASRRIELISNRPGDTVGTLTGETDTQGEQLFSVRTTEPGVIDLRAMDLLSGKLLGSSVQLSADSSYAVGGNTVTTGGRAFMASVYAPTRSTGYNTYAPSTLSGRRFFGQIGSTFDVVHHFEIILDRGVKEVAVYDPLSLEIHAVDRSGNVVEDYTGTVQIYTTDPEALLPSEVRFTPGDFGIKRLSLSLRFQTAGEPNAIGEPTHVVRVEEVGSCASPSAAGCVFGELEVIVGSGDTSGDPGRQITVTTPSQDSMVGSENISVEGKGPPFVNLEITGGAQDVFGETDSGGKFVLAVTLDKRQTDHTLRIRDASGRFDSGNIRVRLDATDPEIGEVTFDPPSPEEGTPVTVIIQSEPGLASMSIILEELETELEATKTASGTYVGIITAPVVGTTMAIVRATDKAGNAGEARVQLTVEPKALPTVTGVRATAKIEQVDLTWTPAEIPVDAYRIYVGMEPSNYSSYLDSPDPRGGATIGGLKPGSTYYFAVTALQEDRESEEKSLEISATVLGLTLDVTPQDGGLLLEWSSLDTDIPLSSFILEYGVEAGNLTEKRTLNGDLRAYALRDLLNDVTYLLKLTPVTTTGDLLEDLAAEGSGAPSGTGIGFKTTSADPVPFSTTTGRPGSSGGNGLIPSSGTVHSGAPATPGVGLPPIAWWIAGSLAAIGFYIHWQRRKTMQMTLHFLQSMETQYKNI